MRRVGLTLVAVLLAALASCSSKPADAIVGKWKQVDGDEVLEFLKDGTLTTTYDSSVETYRFVDENRMRVEGAGKPTMVLTVSITRDELKITYPNGKTTTHRRIK
jgi:uncharacterized protein (DUF2147 family)